MPSSFKVTKPKASLSRNGFDLSGHEIFSAKAGQLLPIMCKPVVPGDSFRINTQSLIRTMPLNSAAFVNMTARFDFFFVSYQSMWHSWDSFITQRDDQTSSLKKGRAYAPCLSMGALEEVTDDYSATTLPTPSTSQASLAYDIQGLRVSDDAVRLVDLLGYGAGASTEIPRSVRQTCSYADVQSVFPIMGYNKVYQDYYANPYYEDLDVTLINCDDLECSTASNCVIGGSRSAADSARLMKLFQMRYAPWAKDYFTSLLPNSQFGSVAVVGNPSRSYNLGVVLSGANHTLDSDVELTSGSTGSSVNVQLYGQTNSSDKSRIIALGAVDNTFDILSLRMAEQLQRWKESTMRAGYRSDDQYMAHFGVKPKNYRAEHVQFLGSHSAKIGIDEVLTTSNTNDVERSTTGDIYGKGIGAVNGRDTIQFNATEWGQIMCIFSVLPEAYYDAATMVQKDHLFHEPFDFYTPEFAKIGLAPVNFSEIGALENQCPSGDAVLGYSNRYANYQTAVDKVHGILQSGCSLKYWTAPRVVSYSNLAAAGVTRSFLFVHPSCLDNIFSLAVDSTQETDQFIVDARFNVVAVRPMPKLSLPNII